MTKRRVLPVKRFDLTSTPMGLKVLAIGLVTSSLCLAVFTFEDAWTVFTGNLPKLGLYGLWYLVLGGVAAAFSAMCIVLWRPLIAKLMATLLSLSMISHILERTITFATPEVRTIAIARVVVSLGLALIMVSISPRIGQSKG